MGRNRSGSRKRKARQRREAMAEMSTGELLRIYAAKALVRHPGAQVKAHRARTLLEARGVDLQPFDTALSHALDSGEGREEFDELIGPLLESR